MVEEIVHNSSQKNKLIQNSAMPPTLFLLRCINWMNTAVVKHFFYNGLALAALPVHLLRPVFFCLFGVFVSRSCSGRVWGGRGGPFGAIGVTIWGAFWVILVTFSG